MKSEVMLVAMPWHRFDLLSIQVGGLKAYLDQHGVNTSARHYYKDLVGYLGLPVYEAIVQSNVGESLFAAMLFPDRKGSLAEIAERSVRMVLSDQSGGAAAEVSFDFDACVDGLGAYVDDILSDAEWSDYTLVGFTSTHAQFTASLFLAKSIKERHPDVRIVFGGFLLRDELARGVLEEFDFVDFVVAGEGELPLLGLVRALEGLNPLSAVPGVLFRDSEGQIRGGQPFEPVQDLDQLPVPDYSDFFCRRLGPSVVIGPIIQVEASRGCRWGRCTFCVEAMPCRRDHYRRKSVEKVLEEIRLLTEACGSLDILFADPDMSDKADVAEALPRLGLDLRIEAELSGFLTRKSLEAFARAGTRHVQIGVESFSQPMLERYHKGVELMRYVELLKWCKELGVSVSYNLIVGAPFETELDIETNLRNMERLRFYQYPFASGFAVSYQAETYRNPTAYGISEIRPNPRIVECYPESVGTNLAALVAFGEHTGYTFRPEKEADPRIIGKIEEWRERFETAEPSLVCRREGTCLDIAISEGTSLQHHRVVDELEQAMYLFCIDSAKSLDQVARNFPDQAHETIRSVLTRFLSAGLMFETGGDYLSLATLVDQGGRT